MIVHAEGDAVDVGVVVLILVLFGNIAVVILVSSEDVEFLLSAQFFYLREDVIASFHSNAHGILSYCSALHRRVACVGLGILYGVNLVDIGDVSVVGLSTHDPVPSVDREVNRSDRDGALHFVVWLAVALDIVGVGVVHGVAHVAAYSHSHSWHDVVVAAGSKAIFVGWLKLKRRSCARVNPSVAIEEHRIKPGHSLHFVAELAGIAPEADASVVPSAWQNGVLALGTIDGEIVKRLVIGIVKSHGDDDMSGSHVCPAGERLLDPELLELHFAAFLLFKLPLGSLVGLVFDGAACARMLKFHLRAHRPAAAEVVADVDDSMGNVESSVGRIVLVALGICAITVDMVAIEHSRHGHFAISADAQPLASNVLHNRVAGHFLRCDICGNASQKCRAQ